jgi:hypothetical protein
MSESALSIEVSATTVLPAPSNVSASVNSNNNVDVAWTNNDDSTDGSIDVKRLKQSADGIVKSSIHGKDIAVQQDQYGTWVAILNYEHFGGTNPPVGPSSTFPQLPNGLSTASDVGNLGQNGELRHVDNIDQYGAWNIDAVRFEGTTELHNRKIHFFTTNQNVINATFTQQSAETNFQDYQGSATTLLADHTANLPTTANKGNADSRSDRLFGAGFPYFESGAAHWAVKGNGNRWEADGSNNGNTAQFNTSHRVWVRVTGSTETTVLNNASTTVASGLSPSTTIFTDTSAPGGETVEYRIERNTDHATATSGRAQVTIPIFVSSTTADTDTLLTQTSRSRGAVMSVNDTDVASATPARVQNAVVGVDDTDNSASAATRTRSVNIAVSDLDDSAVVLDRLRTVFNSVVDTDTATLNTQQRRELVTATADADALLSEFTDIRVAVSENPQKVTFDTKNPQKVTFDTKNPQKAKTDIKGKNTDSS